MLGDLLGKFLFKFIIEFFYIFSLFFMENYYFFFSIFNASRSILLRIYYILLLKFIKNLGKNLVHVGNESLKSFTKILNLL